MTTAIFYVGISTWAIKQLFKILRIFLKIDVSIASQCNVSLCLFCNRNSMEYSQIYTAIFTSTVNKVGFESVTEIRPENVLTTCVWNSVRDWPRQRNGQDWDFRK